MAVKTRFVQGFGAILALSLLTQAKTAPPPLDNATLGILEGSLAFCGKADSESASKYKEAAKLLTKGQPESAVEEKRNSQEYQDALKQIKAQLEKLPPQEAVKQCKASIAGK